MITVARLLHSPIKGLEFVDCAEVVVGPAGAEFDRRFFLVNADGRLVNSVRHGRLCLARAEYDGETLTVYLPDGTVVAAPDPARGEPIELAWEAGHHVSGHVVEGPWAEALAGPTTTSAQSTNSSPLIGECSRRATVITTDSLHDWRHRGAQAAERTSTRTASPTAITPGCTTSQ